MVYDNYSNAEFSQILESVQYNATLAITGAIPLVKNYTNDSDLKVLHDERWYGKLCFCYKMQNNKKLLIQTSSHCRIITYNHCFLLCLWSLLVVFIGTNLTLIFKILPLLIFLNDHYFNLFVLCQHKYKRSIHHPRGVKLLTRLQLSLSQ